ncbi:pyridoxamine 5'-phosphate oxidase family protein [Paraburkholderia sp.]|uniref:FAD-binding oxidoreductase n=1 Tax=Paraburkholderia sp. TaxID=1926495 RepID=UPI00238CF84B|nr:pyridoxamine 5'-phosphate oxidase family protein [Paraburkholderia sp.]MDE1182505.1 pyridoxamine 5'-phosphate oxidase family protein [Paraburkholderia sp.]
MNTETQAVPASPWHAGELTLQRRAGVAERMDDVGRRVVRRRLVDQHRQFYPLLSFVVLGAVDPHGDVWATLRAGRPGFLRAPDDAHLRIGVPRDPSDPADAGMNDGDAIGLLGIDLATRRRNRLNGVVERDDASGFALSVGESFGNCPQYIFQRDPEFTRDPATHSNHAPQVMDALDPRAKALIGRSDSFFVASYVDLDEQGEPRESGESGISGVRQRKVDVSHRGGNPGFVRVGDDGVLTVPDFAGNLFFNTLGNLLVNPRAGLVFVDYTTGDLLQVSGAAEIVLDSPEIATFQGAERLWKVTPQRVVYRPDALPVRWRDRVNGASPNSQLTGNWAQSAARLAAAKIGNAWRPYRVTKIVDESTAIRSFHLQPDDGAGLIPHAAGQHLPVRVTLPGDHKPVIRTYTLSVAPSDGIYRISVKRDGRVSQHLHDTLKVGDTLDARAPAGAFTIDASSQRPAVLIAVGVGVTPMLAMLRQIVYEGLRTRRMRPVWFIHAARTKAERAFDEEIDALVNASNGAVERVRVLSDRTDAQRRIDFDFDGRVTADLLTEILPFNDFDFYLCGPGGFMQDLYDGLLALNVADNRIHAESFGPSGLKRQRATADSGARDDSAATHQAALQPSVEAVPVTFIQSAKEARWAPELGSLLELAEVRGLSPEFSCRVGTCGSCRTRVIEGSVAYLREPTAEIGDGEALICCAVPAASQDGSPGRLVLDL